MKLSEHKVYVDAWKYEAVMLFDKPDDTRHYAEMLVEAHEYIAHLEEELVDAKIDKTNAERLRDNVFADNAELLESLEVLVSIVEQMAFVDTGGLVHKAREAIRKARQ